MESTSQTSSKSQPIAAVLLSRAHDPEETKRILTEKIQQRPLFLTPSSPPPSDARAARRREREKKRLSRKKALKPKPLSANERRKLGLYDVPRSGQKYVLFEPLHQLWLGYIREILGNEIHTGGEGAASKLTSADFHGAEVEVVRSGCVSRVGLKGIVIKDSRFTFEVVTKKNQRKLVPKEGTVFRVEVPLATVTATAMGEEGRSDDNKQQQQQQTEAEQPKMIFEVHGEQFQFRSADRANKKFRSHFSNIL
ncbi:Rof/RNase P-like protein [Neurospora tetraspora]|uniref:Ribonuclease P protein subunit n=1 Tax=Neurospora tetraspora TaxID=94610 RepID=A0AAE0J755_9PEZI|nr:Rof/RNase P-like protein [Neurospora tetraspora]